jgi:hypothetical protein
MTLKDELQWESAVASRLARVELTQREIASGKAPKVTYYWFVGEAHHYAIESYVEAKTQKSRKAAKLVVHAALEYFYGDWRETARTPDGTIGHEDWKPFCLWYEEVMRSLPWACALRNWEAVRRIAEYPPENKFPEAARASGETAWAWALVTFLRGQPRKQVEDFLAKAEAYKSKRPKFLSPALRALLNNDAPEFEKALLAYLAYYCKSEFKRDLDKLLALDGTTLYHLGRKQGFHIQLPKNVADHVIRFD